MCNDPQSILENELLSWYNYINEVLSVLCFTAAITALQFSDYSAEVATASLIFICALGWSLSRKREVKRHDERLERYIGRSRVTLISLAKTPIFWLGVCSLVAVACGADLETVKGISLKNLLNF